MVNVEKGAHTYEEMSVADSRGSIVRATDAK